MLYVVPWAAAAARTQSIQLYALHFIVHIINHMDVNITINVLT